MTERRKKRVSAPSSNPLHKMDAEEFVRRIHDSIKRPERRYALFIGAGCSISSGIPDAGTLVKEDWLPRLRDLRAPERKDLESWAREQFPGSDLSRMALLYGAVMEKLFLNLEERQREVERLCEGKFPGFGYAVLANLIAMDEGRFNVVLTTNFDDLAPDALYLYTEARPLVIHHESLASYIRPARMRPLVVKLHGDHRLSPHNTFQETATLPQVIANSVRPLLHDRGLIFIGYGGNDKGIVEMLDALPPAALPLSVFWVSELEPQGVIRQWLDSRKAIWVQKRDFDELMLLIHDTFKLPRPDDQRFKSVFDEYGKTYEKLSKRVLSLPETVPGAARLKKAVEKTDASLTGWFTYAIQAGRLEKTDPEKAEALYLEGLKKLPDSAPLLGNYAIFLHQIRKDYNKAEEHYRRALAADPNNANTNCNYAIFLKNIRKDYNKAEEHYRRALTADPNLANTNGNYAIFLKDIRKDYDKAEEHYRRALTADPNNATNNGSYAFFLKNIRKDYDKAEELYRRALAADPNNANNLGNYANFLSDIRKDYDKAEEHYRRALAADPNNAINNGNYAGLLLAQGRKGEGLRTLNKALASNQLEEVRELALECWSYLYAHGPATDRQRALTNLKRLLTEGERSTGWGLSDNIARARQDGHPDAQWLEKLAAVISENADIKVLDAWPKWKAA
ncbi:MAG: tetratricopeptide repeat protein [Dehalococcoidia bacterium]|nr:tetratricopeptide repeat protein [Dehalococcoidia bacterium]